MKRFVTWFIAVLFGMVFASATQAADYTKIGDIADIMSASVKSVDDVNVLDQRSNISFKKIQEGFKFTITDVKLTPKDNTKGKGLFTPYLMKIGSAVVDQHREKGNSYFAKIKVPNNGTVSFNARNWAIKAKAPVVEHFYGIGNDLNGKSGFLVLNPDDPWVSAESGKTATPGGSMVNLDTLVIGVVMFPDGTVFPLKLYGEKLEQGVHPDLKKPRT